MPRRSDDKSDSENAAAQDAVDQDQLIRELTALRQEVRELVSSLRSLNSQSGSAAPEPMQANGTGDERKEKGAKSA